MSEVGLDKNISSKFNKSGLFLIGVSGGAAVALSVLCAPFVSPALRRVCLPYVPATPAQIDNVLCALKGRSGSLVDLGSGDGRIVLAAASAGFTADGVELNPWLVYYSRLSALRAGVSSVTSFHRQDLWKFSLKPYNNVVIYALQVLAAASAGFTADGVELNPWLVYYSRLSALRAGVSSVTSFHRQDLWKFSLKPYNNVVIYALQVLAAASAGFTAHGVELNPWLVYYSRLSALRAGVSSVTSFHRQDLWKFSLKPYNNVVIYALQVLAAASVGFTADGVELNPWLVYYSRLSALRAGVSSVTSFHRQDLWKFSLKPYNNVVIYALQVLAAASAGFTAHGVELNPWLVYYSRLSALRAGVSSVTSFHRQDLWKFSLKPYNNVVIYALQVLAAASVGFTADGVELNPWLVYYSRLSALRAGVSSVTSFHRQDLWKFSLKPYNNVVIYALQVLAAASAGFTAHGVELNPWLVYYSRLSALRAGVSSVTSFHRQDLWKFSLKPYNNVVIFGVEEMMNQLEQKMNIEVGKDTHVVACRFPLPSRIPERTIGSGVDTVWLYRFR